MRVYFSTALFLLFAFFLYAVHINAMDDLDPASNLPPELVHLIALSDLSVKDILVLGLLNRKWYISINDDHLWKLLYEKAITHTKKMDDKLDYRENYKIIFPPIRVCFIANKGAMIEHQEYNYATSPRIIMDKTNGLDIAISRAVLDDAFRNALDANCKVICSIYRSSSEPEHCSLDIIDIAERKDVVLVVYAGNDGMRLDATAYEHYQNIIVVTACDENLKILSPASFGELVDIAVKRFNTFSSGTALSLGKFIGYMRSIRPDLTAKDIREILIKSADVTEETKQKIPDGGIFNASRAIEMLKGRAVTKRAISN